MENPKRQNMISICHVHMSCILSELYHALIIVYWMYILMCVCGSLSLSIYMYHVNVYISIHIHRPFGATRLRRRVHVLQDP